MDDDWKKRLIDAVDASDESRRGAALAAGLDASYLNGIASGKQTDITLTKLTKVCAVLKISPVYVMTGFNVSPEMEKLIAEFGSLTPDDRQAIIDLTSRLKFARATANSVGD